jgi:formyl-CoA transferase
MMHEHGVPAGNIYRAPEMLEDAHFKAREAIVRVSDHVFGDIAMQNVAPKLSETPGEIRHAAPLLGEHNEEILGGLLGIGEAELATLKNDGII